MSQDSSLKPRSSTLFHFTKSLDVLKSILRDGFWPRYCLEDIEWQGHNMEFVAFPMVCFCDIPISRISEHVSFYGSFGLGLTKEWGAKNNLNPVMYFAGDNGLPECITSLVEAISHIEDEEKENEANANIRFILAHSKPINGRMIMAGEPVYKDFYQESEWRLVPQNDSVKDFMLKEDFEDKEKLLSHNEDTREHCQVKVSPDDVKYIFVPRDSDIPKVINFIQAELDHFPNADVKVLMSRVTSLESMYEDI